MRHLFLALMLAATPAHASLDAAWRAIPARVPADSVGRVLLGWEQRGGPSVRPGEASYALGQFRYARGEYEAALGAYVRAGARLDGPERLASRHGAALAQLALGRPTSARAAFEEVAHSGSPLRAVAALGVAQCWEAEGHPEKAFDVLRGLLGGDALEAAPAALERYAALATRFHRDRDAADARQRLLRQYPRSLEAARARPAAPPARGPARAAERLQTGAAGVRP